MLIWCSFYTPLMYLLYIYFGILRIMCIFAYTLEIKTHEKIFFKNSI